MGKANYRAPGRGFGSSPTRKLWCPEAHRRGSTDRGWHTRSDGKTTACCYLYRPSACGRVPSSETERERGRTQPTCVQNICCRVFASSIKRMIFDGVYLKALTHHHCTISVLVCLSSKHCCLPWGTHLRSISSQLVCICTPCSRPSVASLKTLASSFSGGLSYRGSSASFITKPGVLVCAWPRKGKQREQSEHQQCLLLFALCSLLSCQLLEPERKEFQEVREACSRSPLARSNHVPLYFRRS